MATSEECSQATSSGVSSLHTSRDASQQTVQTKTGLLDLASYPASETQLDTTDGLPLISHEDIKVDQRGLLPPTKIQRKYKCKVCGVITVNPREYLRHRQQAHQENVKIVECTDCQYACQYRQKLNRHMDLIHRKEQRIPSKARASGQNRPARKRTQTSDASTTTTNIASNAATPTMPIEPYVPYNFYSFWTNSMFINMTEPLDLSLPKRQTS